MISKWSAVSTITDRNAPFSVIQASEVSISNVHTTVSGYAKLAGVDRIVMILFAPTDVSTDIVSHLGYANAVTDGKVKVAVDARYRKAVNMDIALKRTNVYAKKIGVEHTVTEIWIIVFIIRHV